VIVLDVKMPGINGIEALHTIKRISPNTEVILMTGHLSREDEEEGMKGGAFAYLIKPYPIADLMSVIRKAADSKNKSLDQRREE
jgi:DNA-binding NtrC family response regulator